jgi:predicted nucleic acid-binding protein
MISEVNIPRSVFVDTSDWARYLNRLDPLHSEAAKAFKQAVGLGNSLVTTNYVLSELVPLMSVRMRIKRLDVLAAMERVRQLDFLTVVYIDHAHDDSAWMLLRQYSDKEWSLVDAASFVVMQSMGITEALTTDHHFEQAGYIRLLHP